MTRLIMAMHSLLGTDKKMAGLIADILQKTNTSTILDLCSGSGGPMPDVLEILQTEYGLKEVQLTLTDLYPDLKAAEKFNSEDGNSIQYLTEPVDATNVEDKIRGLRTMVGSFHHFPPQKAKEILVSAQEKGEPVCIFEISDNSQPIALWWIALPINFVITLFITPLVRPMSWHQIVFTYLMPIIPICFAWDGAVSNARTYTLSDLDELMEGLESENYTWEKDKIEGRTKQIYLIGYPN